MTISKSPAFQNPLLVFLEPTQHPLQGQGWIPTEVAGRLPDAVGEASLRQTGALEPKHSPDVSTYASCGRCPPLFGVAVWLLRWVRLTFDLQLHELTPKSPWPG